MSWMSCKSCKSFVWGHRAWCLGHAVWMVLFECFDLLKKIWCSDVSWSPWTHVEKIASNFVARGFMKRLSGSVAKPYEKTNEEAILPSFQACLAEIRRDNFCHRRTGRKWKEWKDLNLKKMVLPLPGWEKAFVVLSFFRAKWWVTSVAPWNEQNQQFFRDTTTTRKSWPHTILLFTISLTPIMFVVFVPAKPCSIYDCFNCFFVRWILCSQFASLDTIFYMKLDDFRCNWCELMWPCKFLMFFLRKTVRLCVSAWKVSWGLAPSVAAMRCCWAAGAVGGTRWWPWQVTFWTASNWNLKLQRHRSHMTHGKSPESTQWQCFCKFWDVFFVQ